MLRSALRAGVLGLRVARRWRCAVFEAVGLARYSRTALDDLDRKLEAYLPAAGVFVEAGANDGFRKSNTYYLERFRGWTGVLIEPIPRLAEQCSRRRPRSRVYQCALVADADPGSEVVIRYADMCSQISVDGRVRPQPVWGWDEAYDVTVAARTLSDVLSEAGITEVDFLSLDVEGFEAQVLRGLDLDRWAPRIMLIEVTSEAAQRDVDAVLGSRYERVARLSAHDLLYRLATARPTARR